MRIALGAIAGLAYVLSADPVPAEEHKPPMSMPSASSKFPDRLEPVPDEKRPNDNPGVQLRASAPTRPPEYIGYCRMEADGTIKMFLRAEARYGDRNIVGHSYLEYPPGDPEYQKILKHVGPMKPGDSRSVPRWPD